MTKIQNLLDGLKSRIKTKQERVSEPEDRSIQIIQAEEQSRENILKRNRASRTNETTSKELLFVLWSPERKGNGAEKNT